MKKSLTERIKALPTFLKSETMKKYGFSFIAIILCMLVVAYVMNIWMGLILTLFVILLGTLLYSFANYIIQETNHYVTNLSYKINKGSQDASIKMPIGMLLLDDNGDLRDVYDIMAELNEDILNYPFDFRNAALKFYMSETDDREYGAEMGRYEEFEDNFMKNRGKFRGNIKL